MSDRLTYTDLIEKVGQLELELERERNWKSRLADRAEHYRESWYDAERKSKAKLQQLEDRLQVSKAIGIVAALVLLTIIAVQSHVLGSDPAAAPTELAPITSPRPEPRP